MNKRERTTTPDDDGNAPSSPGPDFGVITGDDFEKYLLTSLADAAEWEVEVTIDGGEPHLARPITEGALGPYRILRPGECAWGVGGGILPKGPSKVTMRDGQGRVVHRLIVKGFSVTHVNG